MSSTGQIAGGLIGGVVGFFNPALGVALGAQIGIMVGGLLDPPKGPNTSGPRLSDLTVQTSTYGASIPRLYGTVAIAGNIFWLENNKIKETPVTKKTGGKGGKPKSKQTTWVNTATFAVGLCKGPIVAIRRVWIKGELFYDGGATDLETLKANNAAASQFKLYLGTDTQLPDPRIEANLGAGSTPAWRGLAYIVFYDLDLRKYGETLAGAQVKVEVVQSGVEYVVYGQAYTTLTKTNGLSGKQAWSGSQFCFLKDNGPANPHNEYATSPDGITWTNRTFPVSKHWTGVAYGRGLFVAFGGGDKCHTSVDGINWVERTLPGSSTAREVVYNGSWFVMVGDAPNEFWRSRDGLTWSSVTHAGAGVCGGVTWDKTLRIFAAVMPIDGLVLTSQDGLTWVPYSIPVIPSGAVIGSKEGRILILPHAEAPTFAIYSDDGTTWTTSTSASLPANFVNNDGYPYTLTQDNNNFLHPITGGLGRSEDGLVWEYTAFTGAASVMKWDAICFNGSIIVGHSYSQAPPTVIIVTPYSLTVTQPLLTNIVAQEMLNSGIIQVGDIEMSLMTPDIYVRGYVIASSGSIRAALEPLRAAFPFDVVQTGYQLSCISRGQTTGLTIDARDLGAVSGDGDTGAQVTASREMDSQLPRKMTIKHIDYDREYDIGEQHASRATERSVDTEVIDLPIVMTSSEAAGKAEVLLYMRWLERYDVAITLPATYNNLEPADVVTLTSFGEDTLERGARQQGLSPRWAPPPPPVTAAGSVDLRLTSINYTSDGRVECKAKYNSAAVYSPAGVGAAPVVSGPTTMASDGLSDYALLDVPYLSSSQADASILVSMWGESAAWPGGVLLRTDDAGTTWTDIQSFAAPGGIYGTADNVIGDVDSRVWDKASQLTVLLASGDVFDVTELAVLNGSNYFAYGDHGRWEIIGVQKCTLLFGSVYTFSDMLRGRFGTEWAMSTHQVGDRLVALSVTDVTAVGMAVALIGLSRQYRGVTYDQDISSSPDTDFTYYGVNLECLSPVHLKASKVIASNDWNMEWVRRSRTDGEWRDLVDAGLGESTESYEVYIYTDNTFTTVKRTISSVTQSCTYTSAQQVADFTVNQATIYWKVAQLSSVVGPGYLSVATTST